MAYKVKLDVFEGPFDLLVYLIEHARMSIYDIRVSEITTQYLDYIAQMEAADINVAEEFMVLAAELIELKSRMLLPRNVEDPAQESEDPRAELVARILEYKQYKEMAAFLQEQEELVSHIHTKPQDDLSVYTDEADELLKTDSAQFAAAFRSFLFRKKKLEDMHRVYERIERRRMSVENKINQIRAYFRGKKELYFSEMVEGDGSAYNKVITFMSVLQLLKDRQINAEQKKRFGDIKITLADGVSAEEDM